MFDNPSFDLAAYLARIGFAGAAEPTPAALQALVTAHVTTIPFENLDPFTRRPVALDIDALQQKLVRDGRGGWCYEHNLLFGHALAAIGFEVTGLAARVLMNVPAGVVRPRTHMLLRIDLDGHPHVVDVGFGGLTLTGVLRLEPDAVQETPHEPFRVAASADGFIMAALVRESWVPLYGFDLQPQLLADYEMPNWMLQNHPASHFLATLIAARPERDRRYALLNAELATHHLRGGTERRSLTTLPELRETLADIFRIKLPEGADIDASLEEVVRRGQL